jgi:hypothetical protein
VPGRARAVRPWPSSCPIHPTSENNNSPKFDVSSIAPAFIIIA